MVKLTDNAVIQLHDAIQTAATNYEVVNLSVVDKTSIVGSIIVESGIFHVNAKVMGVGEEAGGSPKRVTQAFTILCAINNANGTSGGGLWEYDIPHPFGGLEYAVSVLNSNTHQEQHVDVVRFTDHAIINIAQQAAQCYDVIFIGYVA